MEKMATHTPKIPDPIVTAMIDMLNIRMVNYNIKLRKPQFVALSDGNPEAPLVLHYNGDQLLYMVSDSATEICVLVSAWEQWNRVEEEWVIFENVVNLISLKGQHLQVNFPFLGLIYDVKKGALKK